MILVFCVGAAVSVVATGLVIPLLVKVGMWDVSNGRSSHTGRVPRGGGIGMLAGFTASLLIAAPHLGRQSALIMSAALLMGLIGLVDDVRGIRPLPRLAIQAAAGVALALSAVAGEDWSLPYAAAALVVGTLWIVACINAFNFMDGINGMSALSATVAGLWYAWVGEYAGHSLLVGLGLALAGASLGFLPWNAPRARVFLGDVGSYGIGAVVAFLALVAWEVTGRLDQALAPLVIYLADTAWTLASRARRGAPLLEPHREHAYQRLAQSLGSHLPVSVAVASAATLVCLAAGAWPMIPALVIALIVASLYLLAPTALESRVTT